MPGVPCGGRAALFGCVLAALAACGTSKPNAAAVAPTLPRAGATAAAAQGPAAGSIRRFHERLDAADFAAIWADADESFRQSVPRADYERFMTNAHARLGNVVATANVRSTPVGAGPGATLLLAQNTTFQNGAGLETFTFLVTPDGARLIGYNLQSPALAGS
jgi:hypothetical protein